MAGAARFACVTHADDEPWHVPDAPIRFTLVLQQMPSHRSAGFFTHLPDGGVLPGRYPDTHLVTANGEALDSYVLWHNRGTGAALVFEAPAGDRTVHVYVTGADRLRTWTPASGLTPSPIICADPSGAALDIAAKLAGLGAIGPRVHFAVNPTHPRTALPLSGNPSGRPPPCSLYLLAYLAADRPGRTWVAPITLRGQTRVSIDGRAVNPQRQSNKWGGTGEWLDLEKGLHRLDILAADAGPDPFWEGRGILWITWRPPGTTADELGGTDPDTGAAAWASRVVEHNEIVRSGSARIQRVVARDGAPVAFASITPKENFWFEGEAPILVYELSAALARNPRDTSYVWSFGNGITAEGRSILWPVQGFRDHTVRLTARDGNRESTCATPFYAYAPVQTSMEDAGARAAFRAACLELFQAHPEDVDPTAGWNDAFWNNLVRNMELGKGAALLAHIFTVRWDTFEKKLSAERRRTLEDFFVLPASRLDPENAVKWIERFKKDAEREREIRLSLKQADVYMYYLDNLDAARDLVKPFIRLRGELAQRARIRLGDIEFLAGNLPDATELYGGVQDELQRTANTEAKLSRLQTLSGGGLARSRKELAEQQQDRTRSPARRDTRTVDEWKINAIREVANAERVKELIADAYYEEARAALDRWELHFPLSKVSGDYMIHDARFFMAIEDYVRARRILESYCEQVDASSYIPEALQMLVDCMLELKVDDEELVAFCETVKERLEFHPAAAKIDRILKVLRSDEGERQPTRDSF
jgi:hypothetical protein